MAFTREAIRTPVAVGEIHIELIDAPLGLPPAMPATKGATYRVQILYSDGTTDWRNGDLVPHITQNQINQLLAFMDAMRTKAVAEFIGT